MVTFALKGMNLDAYVLYMDHTIGWSGNNVVKGGEVAGNILARRNEYFVIGDMNMSPAKMSSSGFVDLVKGNLVVPQDVTTTCRGSRDILDYAIASRGAAALLYNVGTDLMAPFNPHAAVSASINARPRTVKLRVALKPCAFNLEEIKRKIKEGEALPVWRQPSLVGISEHEDQEHVLGLLHEAPLCPDVGEATSLAEEFAGWSRSSEDWLCEADDAFEGKRMTHRGTPPRVQITPLVPPKRFTSKGSDPLHIRFTALYARIKDSLLARKPTIRFL